MSDPITPAATAAMPMRDERGRLLPGHTITLKTGEYSERELPCWRQAFDAFLAQSVADDGGDQALSERRRSLHAYRARTHVRILALEDAIDARGLFDKRGRLRVAWLTKREGLIGTALRIDSQLGGLDRRPRRVQTVDDYLNSTPDTGAIDSESITPTTDRSI